MTYKKFRSRVQQDKVVEAEREAPGEALEGISILPQGTMVSLRGVDTSPQRGTSNGQTRLEIHFLSEDKAARSKTIQ